MKACRPPCRWWSTLASARIHTLFLYEVSQVLLLLVVAFLPVEGLAGVLVEGLADLLFLLFAFLGVVVPAFASVPLEEAVEEEGISLGLGLGLSLGVNCDDNAQKDK